MKRKSFPSTSAFDSGYDPFDDDAYLDENIGRKKTKYSRPSEEWRYIERTPSPEVETPHENDIQDEIPPTEELLNGGEDLLAGESSEGLPSEPAQQSQALSQQRVDYDQDQASQVTESHPEGDTSSPDHLRDTNSPLRINTVVASPHRGPTDEITSGINTPDQPRLRPLPSAGLPLVSPLLNRKAHHGEGFGQARDTLYEDQDEHVLRDDGSSNLEDAPFDSDVEDATGDIVDRETRSQYESDEAGDSEASFGHDEEGSDEYTDEEEDYTPTAAHQDYEGPFDHAKDQYYRETPYDDYPMSQHSQTQLGSASGCYHDESSGIDDEVDFVSRTQQELDSEGGREGEGEVEIIEINSDSDSEAEGDSQNEEVAKADFEDDVEHDGELEEEDAEDFSSEVRADHVKVLEVEEEPTAMPEDSHMWDLVDLDNNQSDISEKEDLEIQSISGRSVDSCFAAQDTIFNSQSVPENERPTLAELATEGLSREDEVSELDELPHLGAKIDEAQADPSLSSTAISSQSHVRSEHESFDEPIEQVSQAVNVQSESGVEEPMSQDPVEVSDHPLDPRITTHVLTPVPTQQEESVSPESSADLERIEDVEHQILTPQLTQDTASSDRILHGSERLQGSSIFDRLRELRASSSRRLNGEIDSRGIEDSSLWFTPSKSDLARLGHQRAGGDNEDSEASSVIHEDQTDARFRDETSAIRSPSPDKHEEDHVSTTATGALPTPPPTSFRTPLSYFAPLDSIAQHFGTEIDVLAVTVSCTVPVRAQSGPRDYFQTIYLADPSSNSASSRSFRIAQLFRPFKAALPVTKTGDAILLRNFKVQTSKKDFILVSTNSSAWAVFRQGEEVNILGPPVELGAEERAFANHLRGWWDSLDEESRQALQDAVPKPQEAVQPKGKERQSTGRLMDGVHELRDGTRYADGEGEVTNRVHELRNGTTYMDET